MAFDRLPARRAGIDTCQQPVVYMRSDCPVCRAEGFEAQTQVELIAGGRHVLAILNHVSSDWLRSDEIALSEAAWTMLGAADAQEVEVRHPPQLESLAHLRAKVHGGSGRCVASSSENAAVSSGAAPRISPADDMLILVERPLSLDSEGLLVASILSKKAAVGSERVLIDLPVGPQTKVRSAPAAKRLSQSLVAVGAALGLQVLTVFTDGSQPVGRGIGPALEAMDVMAVLERTPGAPADLRERALLLAGLVLEMAGRAARGQGQALAREVLDDGRALAKYIAICEAQGGLRIPPKAAHTHAVPAPAAGVVLTMDTRLLARVAKLAGAPRDPAAGATVHVRRGDRVDIGQPLYTLHAESPGALRYALAFTRSQLPVAQIGAGP
jgi:thymidine phosphorylase